MNVEYLNTRQLEHFIIRDGNWEPFLYTKDKSFIEKCKLNPGQKTLHYATNMVLVTGLTVSTFWDPCWESETRIFTYMHTILTYVKNRHPASFLYLYLDFKCSIIHEDKNEQIEQKISLSKKIAVISAHWYYMKGFAYLKSIGYLFGSSDKEV